MHQFALSAPLLLSCAEIDSTFPIEKRRRAEDILVGRKFDYHIQVFGGVKHGFASHGDIKDAVIRKSSLVTP